MAWATLRTTYEPTTRARLARLRRQFITCHPTPAERIEFFLNRIQEAAAQLTTAGAIVPDSEVAFQMIDVLPPDYNGIVLNIYQWPDLDFTSAKVKEALISEADRLRLKDNDTTTDMMTTQKSSTPSKRDNNDRKPSARRRETRTCYNCGLIGHLSNQCRNPRKATQRKWPNNNNIKDKPSYDVMTISGSDEYLINSDEWIWDSGAGSHLCNDTKWFKTFKQVTPIDMKSYCGTFTITGIGDVAIEHKVNGKTRILILRNVGYAPKGRRNLISGFQIDKAGYSWTGGKLLITIQNKNGETINQFKGEHGLYRMYGNPHVGDIPYDLIECNAIAEDKSDLALWHRRLGHYGAETILKMSKSQCVRDLPLIKQKHLNCDVCLETKMIKLSRKPIPERTTTRILQLVHTDVWGPSAHKSGTGSVYYITFIDDYTRWGEVAVMKHKWEVFDKIQEYIKKMERKTGKQVVTIRSDNGMEYCSNKMRDLFDSLGIEHQRTNVYTPQQNGIAERYNRTALNALRAMLKDGQFPPHFWAEMLFNFNYLKNRLPQKKLHDKTPFELRYGYVPSVKHLKRIGCTVHYFVPKETRRNKFSDSAKKGKLVGYAFNTRGYRIWNPETDKIIECDNVKCNEDLIYIKKDNENNEYVRFGVDDPDEVTTKSQSQPVQEEIQKPEEATQQNFSWTRIAKKREKGKSAGLYDIYYKYGDNKKPLRSVRDVLDYCKDNNLKVNPDQIDFSKKNTYSGTCDLHFDDDESSNNGDQDENPTTNGTTSGESNNAEFYNNLEFCNVNCDDPMSYEEATKSEDASLWHVAMDEEITTLRDREVFKQVKRPKNHKVLGNRWVFTRKRNDKGQVVRHRARLVAQGFAQNKGSDYQDIYAPVVDFALVRLFLYLLVVLRKWSNKHIDIKCAYLYGDLDETTYMEIPNGYKINDNLVWKLQKSIYGLHQSSRCWFYKLDQEVKKLGFINLSSCQCVYRFNWDYILLVYVDDIIILARNDYFTNEAMKKLESIFDLQDLGEIKTFLGIDIQTNQNGMTMSQSRYILKMHQKFTNIPFKRCYEPMKFGTIIRMPRQDELDSGKDTFTAPYRNLIGCLLYIARHTRPDILYAVNTLAKYCNNYTPEIWNHLVHLWNFVISTKDKKLKMEQDGETNIIAYSDASWASDIETRKSTTGYIILIGDTPIVWRSTKQSITALSTMEAELIAAVETTKEIIYLQRIIQECGTLFPLNGQLCHLKIDNQAAIHCIRNHEDNARTKYIDLRKNFIREKVLEGLLQVSFINSNNNIADLFTKPLPKSKLSILTPYLDC